MKAVIFLILMETFTGPKSAATQQVFGPHRSLEHCEKIGTMMVREFASRRKKEDTRPGALAYECRVLSGVTFAAGDDD